MTNNNKTKKPITMEAIEETFNLATSSGVDSYTESIKDFDKIIKEAFYHEFTFLLLF